MTSRIKYTKGRTTFKGALKVSHEAMSRKVEDILLRKVLPDRADEVAKEIQEDYIDTTRAYYSAMIAGAADLIHNSGVKVQATIGTRTTYKRVKRGAQTITRHKVLRGSFSPEIKHSQALQYRNKPFNVPDRLEITFQQKWKLMSAEYANRRPESEVFFRKRYDSDPESSRMAFGRAAKTWKQIANRPSAYRNRLAHTNNQAKGVFKTTFRISFPSLGPQFDFMRRAFLNGMASVHVPDLGDSDIAGIARAEQMRPLLRPYAAEVGKEWRETLEKKLNKAPKEI